MTHQFKQIVPEPQSVVRCLDRTFLISELLEILKTPENNQELFIEQLEILHLEMKTGGYSRDHYRDKVEVFLEENAVEEDITIMEAFKDEVDCSLLQLDGKGWKKGKLKICFEFIPKEDELVVIQENPSTTQYSSLDEIRQLTSSLPIDQN